MLNRFLTWHSYLASLSLAFDIMYVVSQVNKSRVQWACQAAFWSDISILLYYFTPLSLVHDIYAAISQITLKTYSKCLIALSLIKDVYNDVTFDQPYSLFFLIEGRSTVLFKTKGYVIYMRLPILFLSLILVIHAWDIDIETVVWCTLLLEIWKIVIY